MRGTAFVDRVHIVPCSATTRGWTESRDVAMVRRPSDSLHRIATCVVGNEGYSGTFVTPTHSPGAICAHVGIAGFSACWRRQHPRSCECVHVCACIGHPYTVQAPSAHTLGLQVLVRGEGEGTRARVSVCTCGCALASLSDLCMCGRPRLQNTNES
jgi:hypothetical protein